MKSENLSQLQTVPFLPTFLCALLLLFSKWYSRAGPSVSLPLEHMLKMENKMHCDILAKRPFSGFGKSQLNRHSLSHNRKKKKQNPAQMSSRSLFAAKFSAYIWLFFLFIFKNKGSELLQFYLSSHKSLPPCSHKSHPHKSKTCITFFKLARVLHLNGMNSLTLIHIFQRNWPKLPKI